jgi:hypothetical protein
MNSKKEVQEIHQKDVLEAREKRYDNADVIYD